MAIHSDLLLKGCSKQCLSSILRSTWLTFSRPNKSANPQWWPESYSRRYNYLFQVFITRPPIAEHALYLPNLTLKPSKFRSESGRFVETAFASPLPSNRSHWNRSEKLLRPNDYPDFLTVKNLLLAILISSVKF